MELHDGRGLDSIGEVLCVDDLVQVSLSPGNASDVLPLRRCELEVARTNVRMVPLLVQGCYRYERAPDRGGVQCSDSVSPLGTRMASIPCPMAGKRC